MEEFRPRALSVEQRKSLREQALVQAEVNVENARINYRLAIAALEALREECEPEPTDGDGRQPGFTYTAAVNRKAD